MIISIETIKEKLKDDMNSHVEEMFQMALDENKCDDYDTYDDSAEYNLLCYANQEGCDIGVNFYNVLNQVFNIEPINKVIALKNYIQQFGFEYDEEITHHDYDIVMQITLSNIFLSFYQSIHYIKGFIIIETSFDKITIDNEITTNDYLNISDDLSDAIENHLINDLPV